MRCPHPAARPNAVKRIVVARVLKASGISVKQLRLTGDSLKRLMLSLKSR